MSRKSTRTSPRTSTKRRSSRKTKLPVRPIADIERKRTWLFYGRPGSAKTTLFSTWPGKKLLLDVMDEGTDSISDVPNIDVMDITEWDQIEEAYWYLHENPDEYDVVCIDTVTALQQIIIEEIGAKKKLKGKRAGDWGTMTKADWGTVASRMKTWITNYRNLPMEVVFLAQDRVFSDDTDEEDEEGLDAYLGPCLSPSVKTHIGAEVTVIGQTFVRRRKRKIKKRGKTVSKSVIEYCLRLGPDPSYMIKVRKPKGVRIPEVLVDPSYEELIEIIQGD